MTQNNTRIDKEFSVSKRLKQKYLLFRDRMMPGVDYVMCELCGETIATDLHEIFNRVHYKAELLRNGEMPRELLSCLCNHCNVNFADTRDNRAVLLQASVQRYGIDAVNRALDWLVDRSNIMKPEGN